MRFFVPCAAKKKSKKGKYETLGEVHQQCEFKLESSERKPPKIDSSQWPLLLKVSFRPPPFDLFVLKAKNNRYYFLSTFFTIYT
jgi:hypothetical protein